MNAVLRSIAGLMIILSFVIGAATWLFSASVTFDIFGWIGLIVGLLILGIGVVPLAIIAAFLEGESGVLWRIIIMLIATFALRSFGSIIMEETSSESGNHD